MESTSSSGQNSTVTEDILSVQRVVMCSPTHRIYWTPPLTKHERETSTGSPQACIDQLGSSESLVKSLSQSSDGNTSSTSAAPPPHWTKCQWLTLIIQCVLIFAAALAYSLLFTFFPQEAQVKGASSTIIGFIFGFFELVVFVMSPIYGAKLNIIGPRFMCLSGSFLCGGCCLLFGFVDQCPDGLIFIVMCFLIRTVEANGAAMLTVAGYTILSETFPEQVGLVNSIAEMIMALGMMLGPVVGAALYGAGGFLLPFLVIGSIFLLACLVALFTQPMIEHSGHGSKNFLKLCTKPGIVLLYIHICGSSMCLTFLDPTMSQWLQNKFSLNVTIIGVVFLVWSGVYSLASPVIGKLVDKGYIYSTMISGGLACSLSFLLIGPAPFLEALLGKDKQLWLVIVCCALLGFSCAAMFIPPYLACLNIAEVQGYDLDLSLYAMMSGIVSSASSLGAFLGPTFSGLLNESIGFEWSVTICAFVALGLVTLQLFYVFAMIFTGQHLSMKRESLDKEREPLLK